MSKILIISENERIQISKMYGLSEQSSPSKAQSSEPIKLQVFGFDRDTKDSSIEAASNVKEVLIMLIEMDPSSITVRNLITYFTYTVRGEGSKEYEGMFDSSEPGNITLNKCELLDAGLIDSSYNQRGAGPCPQVNTQKFSLSTKGSTEMERRFGKESYSSNSNGGDVSDIA